MAATYLKKASKTAETSDGETRLIVMDMLAKFERSGEAAARDYAQTLDGWNGEIVVSQESFRQAERTATRDVAQVASRISRLEGMEGHAMTGDVRLAKYFPGEDFRLSVEGLE